MTFLTAMIQCPHKVISSHGRGFFVGEIFTPLENRQKMTKSSNKAVKSNNLDLSRWRPFLFSSWVKKLILPILCSVLILRPIFLGGALWTNAEALAAAKPAGVTGQSSIADPKIFDVWVTAYSSVPEETDDSPFITATNKTVRDGFIAANFLPFGTRVKIPKYFGDKIFIVEDRMSRRKDNFMDIWMPTKEKALAFGIHQTSVIVIEMGTIPNPLIAKNTTEKNPAD